MFDFLSKAGDAVMDSLSSAGSAVANGVESGLTHTFEKLQDPEFMQQVGLMSAALSNDQNRYQGALNAYDNRRQEIAKQKREDMQRAQAREEKLFDLKMQYERQDSIRAEDREWKTEDKLDDRAYQGEVRQEGYAREDYTHSRNRQEAIDDRADWTISGDHMYNKRTSEVRPLGDGNGRGGDGVVLGDGQVVNEPGMYELSDGTLVKVEKAATGKFTAKIPSAGERESYRVKNTAANQSLVEDFDLIKNSNLSPAQIEQMKKEGQVVPEQAKSFYITGVSGDAGEAPWSSNLLTKVIGSDTDRAVKLAADRLDASMTNMGVAEAKAMGASGINTIAEVKQFAASMPKLDRSSEGALRGSIEKINSYVNAWNADRAKTAPTKKVGSTQDQPSQRYPDGTVLEKGGKRYVVQGGKPVLQ